MLTLLIDAAIGGVAAFTLHSVVSSTRAFLPLWRRLKADLDACDNERTVRITVRQFVPVESGAVIFRPAFGKAAIKPQSAALQPCLRAVA